MNYWSPNLINVFCEILFFENIKKLKNDLNEKQNKFFNAKKVNWCFDWKLGLKFKASGKFLIKFKIVPLIQKIYADFISMLFEKLIIIKKPRRDGE